MATKTDTFNFWVRTEEEAVPRFEKNKFAKINITVIKTKLDYFLGDSSIYLYTGYD